MRRLLIAAVLLAGCTWVHDNPAPTFGDGAVRVSEAFCQRSIDCGQRIEQAYGHCVDRQILLLCDEWDCSEGLTRDEDDLMNRCADDFREWNCSFFLPSSCYEVLDL